jgi:hypothetical protein
MEMSQGNSLCSNLKQKCHFFFSFTKAENRRVEQILPGGRVVPVGGGGGRRWGKGMGGQI